jgi:type III secretion inner rod protein HrpB2
MAPIEPVAAISAALPTPGPGGHALPTEAAVKRFEALMARTESMLPTQHLGPAPVDGPGAVNPVAHALSVQEAALREIDLKIQDFTSVAPSLGLNEMVSRSIALSSSVAKATTALTCTTAIAQGANKGLQSLLKNQ